MSRARAVAVLAAIGLLAPAVDVAARPAVEGTDVIPVRGTFVAQPGRANGRSAAVGVVHGVRRVEGGTVLYFSLGYPSDGGNVVSLQRPHAGSDRPNEGAFHAQVLVDPVGLQAYGTLVRADRSCLCSRWDDMGRERGLWVLYQVLPELPPTVETVDVQLAFGAVVPGVPVEEGVLEPAVDPTQPIRLGTGWPRVDLEEIAAAPDPAASVFPLEQRISDLAEEVSTVETIDEVAVELAADVLFDLDSDVLTPDASARIEAAAATVNERAAGGVVRVVGHTDSTGDTAYNADLSRRRATAVRAALEPLVTVDGVTFEVEGRGESEPIDDNGTELGRRRNRRVAVTFTPRPA